MNGQTKPGYNVQISPDKLFHNVKFDFYVCFSGQDPYAGMSPEKHSPKGE